MSRVMQSTVDGLRREVDAGKDAQQDLLDDIADLEERLSASEKACNAWKDECATRDRALADARLQRDTLMDERSGSVWIWMDNEEDDPDSLSCPVFMRPDVVRRLVRAERELRIERNDETAAPEGWTRYPCWMRVFERHEDTAPVAWLWIDDQIPQYIDGELFGIAYGYTDLRLHPDDYNNHEISEWHYWAKTPLEAMEAADKAYAEWMKSKSKARALHEEGYCCSCHLRAPCGFCEALNEEEIDIHDVPRTQKEIEAARARLRKAATQALTGVVHCAGDGCTGSGPIRYYYRCFFCGLWFCRKCGAIHFGEKERIPDSSATTATQPSPTQTPTTGMAPP